MWMKLYLILPVLFALVLPVLGQTSCDFSLQGISMTMQSFNTDGYNPLKIMQVFPRLHSLRACVLTTYQLCFNKIIPDPNALFPQDKSECLMGLYNVSLLQAKYGASYSKIKADIDSIAKIVFMTENNCYPIMNYTGKSNISDDCKGQMGELRASLNQYLDNITLGGDGLKYVNNLILLVEKQRKNCGFDILVKPKKWTADTCGKANQEGLYMVGDKIESFIGSSNYLNFTAKFYYLYQSIYRVQNMCPLSNNLSYQ